jgi:hypothetical protein
MAFLFQVRPHDERRFPLETRNDQPKRPEPKQDKPKSRLERWIEQLEERIAPSACGHYNPQGKLVGYHYGQCNR